MSLFIYLFIFKILKMSHEFICSSRTRKRLCPQHYSKRCDSMSHVEWDGSQDPSTYNYVGGVVNPTLVLSLKLRTQLSFHVPNDLIGVSLFALALLFLGSDFRRMVYTDISLVFSPFHTPKKSVSKEVMLAFESFPITPLVRCFQHGAGPQRVCAPYKMPISI